MIQAPPPTNSKRTSKSLCDETKFTTRLSMAWASCFDLSNITEVRLTTESLLADLKGFLSCDAVTTPSKATSLVVLFTRVITERKRI